MPADEEGWVPDWLLWLKDAPLFIDESQVSRFYDAVVRPATKQGPTTIELSEENVEAVRKKLGFKAGISANKLLTHILSVSGDVSGEREREDSMKSGHTLSVQLEDISTPQRQLEQLAIHYVLQLPSRYWFVRDRAGQKEWRDPAWISGVPRALVFLDLPSEGEAQAGKMVETKLIPMAAEFADGKVDPLHESLKGTKGDSPPRYIERARAGEDLTQNRKDYWSWFDENFRALTFMKVLEQAASEHGRIQWIDYRLPLTNEGETMHLHVSPAGQFDTGVFAYNVIKRGFSSGLRLVGTLKSGGVQSGPDMNVLAIYDR